MGFAIIGRVIVSTEHIASAEIAKDGRLEVTFSDGRVLATDFLVKEGRHEAFRGQICTWLNGVHRYPHESGHRRRMAERKGRL